MAGPRREHGSRTRRKDPAPPSPSRGCPNSVPGLQPAARGCQATSHGKTSPSRGAWRKRDLARCRLQGLQAGGARVRASATWHLRGGSGQVHSAPRLASAQPLGPGPSESRCSELQPPAGFCAGFSADIPIFPRNNWARRYLDASPAQSLIGPLAAVPSWAGREPRRAAPLLGVQSQPGWLRIKEPRPSFSAFRSYLRPPSGAPRPLRLWAGVPSIPPSGGPEEGWEWGVGTSAQRGHGRVWKTLPIRSPSQLFWCELAAVSPHPL